MADEPTESITIEFPDVPATTETEQPAEKPAQPSESPEDVVAALRKQLEQSQSDLKSERERFERESRARREEERRRHDAEAAARTQQTRADQESAQVRNAQYDSVVNALTAAESRAANLAGQKAALMADGKWDDASKLDVQIAEVGADLANLKRGKATLDEERKIAPAEPVVATPRTAEQERESWIGRLPAESASWIRQHYDRFWNDQEFRDGVMRAAQEAEGKLGINHRNPKYFQHIEEAVGIRQKEASMPQERMPAASENTNSVASREVTPRSSPQEPQPVAAPVQPSAAPRTSAAPASAPPSRTTPSSSPTTPGTKITLTPEERAIARATFTKDSSDLVKAGMDPEEAYARTKLKIQKEHGGRMPVWTPQGRT